MKCKASIKTDLKLLLLIISGGVLTSAVAGNSDLQPNAPKQAVLQTVSPAAQQPAENDEQDSVMPLSPEGAQRYMRMGELAHNNGDNRQASEYLKRALTGLQDPAIRRQAIHLLHTVLLDGKYSDEAANLLKNAATMNDFNHNADHLVIMKARAAFHNKDYQQVIRLCSSKEAAAVPEQYLQSERLELLARSFDLTGNHKEALKNFEALLNVADSNSAAQLAALEGILLNSLEFKDTVAARVALTRLHKAIPAEKQPLYKDHLLQLEWLLSCLEGKASEVEKIFLQYVADKKPSTDALLARIALLLADKRFEIKEFDQAIKLNTMAFKMAEKEFRAAALRALIETKLAAKQLTGALQDILLYLHDYPIADDYSAMKLTAANLNNHLQNTKAAQTDYQQLFADSKVPVNIRYSAALELAKLYQKSNQQPEAIDHMKFAIANAPDADTANDLKHRLGEYLYQLGRYADAAVYFNEAAQAGSKHSGLWLAQSYYQLKDFKRADQALQMFTGHADADLARRAAYLQALLAEKLRNSDEAVKCYIDFVKRYPTSPEAPEALFQAGVLALNSQSFDAYKLFQKYATDYPGERAANALYKALSELLTENKEKEAEDIFKQLVKSYPESKYTLGGYFSMIGFLRNNKRHSEALKLLEQFTARYQAKHPELIPEILYDQAVLCGELKQYTQMRQALEQLTQKYADHAIAPQAFFMLGDLDLTNGKYCEALTSFQQAQERSRGGIFAYGCIGRTADAAYALYTTTRQKQYLHQAAECYKNLLKVKDLPAEFYFQSLYKLGNCQKAFGNDAAALHSYREVLYRAWLAQREGRFYPQQWCAKSLDAAMKILLPAIEKSSSSVEFYALKQEAEQLLKIAEAMELPGEDIKNFTLILKNIKKSK